MSRINSKTETLFFNPVLLDEDISSFSSIVSGYPVSNAYDDTDNNTACRININTGSRATSEIYFNFDCSSIPSNATISAISCSVKASISATNSNQIATRQAQLFSGTTAKGSAATVANSTTAFSVTTGSWTRQELDNAKLRFYAVRGTRQTTTARYFAIYGARLSITYHADVTEYEITTSVTSPCTITFDTSSEYVESGHNKIITLNNVTDITTLAITDNGNNVTSELEYVSANTYKYTLENILEDHTIVAMNVTAYNVTVTNNSTNVLSTNPTSGSVTRKGEGSDFDVEFTTTNINYINIFDDNVKVNSSLINSDRYEIDDSLTLHPTSYSDNTFGGNGTLYLDRGLTDASSNTYASFQISGTGTTYTIDYNFDTTAIPSNAIINSISCNFKICVTNTLSTTGTGVRLYSGENEKSGRNYSWYQNTTPNQYSLTGIQSFTREELNDLKLNISGRSSSAGRRIYFYGATLAIQYTYEGDLYYIYTSENIQNNKIIRFEDKVQYNITSTSNLNGSSITPSSISIYEGESYTVVINTSNIIAVVLYDNNVNVTSNIINDNGTYKYVISNIIIDHSLRIEEFTNYTLTATSNFNKVTITPSSIKIYDGQSASFTITAQNSHYKLFDNNTDVTSNIVSNIYTINNVHEIHTLIIEEQTKYEITASGYQNTTISPSSTYVYEGESITFTISNFNNNFYLFDNNINVTSSLQSQGNLTHTYEINNVHETHSIRIESKPKYSITVTQYNKITGTPSSTQVYEGESITITLNNFNSNFYIFDNNVNVTSSVVSNTTYTINNVHEIHNIRFEEIPRYNITLINNVGGGISLTAQPYSYIIEGESSTIEIVGSITSNLSYFIEQYSVLDNGIDIASQFTQVTGSGHYPKIQYILNNIITDHTIILQRKTLPLYIKISGQYTAINRIYQRSSSVWIEYTQTDYTQLFESDKIYINK